MAIDPVCGMAVDPARTSRTSVYAGQTYFFWAPSCKKLFEANPARYLDSGYRPSMAPHADPDGASHAVGCGCASCSPASELAATR